MDALTFPGKWAHTFFNQVAQLTRTQEKEKNAEGTRAWWGTQEQEEEGGGTPPMDLVK